MNPSERLAEIAAEEFAKDYWCNTCGVGSEDIVWLIHRVRRLTEVLERIEKKTNPMGLINNIAKKALEGSDE